MRVCVQSLFTDKAGISTATEMRNLPIETPYDMKKLFKKLGVNYGDGSSAKEVKDAIKKTKREERKARNALKPTGLKL